MFPRNDKRRLYELMDMYLSGFIEASTFCDEFYYSYDLEMDYKALSKDEYSAFSDLSTVSGRFSEFEGDHKKYPGAYFNEEQLKQKIIETKEKLKNFAP